MCLTTLAGLCVIAAGCGGTQPGKLAVQSVPQRAEFHTTTAHPFTFGDIFVTNKGNATITFTRVTLVRPTGNVRVVGQLARPATVHTFVLSGDDFFPPTSRAAKRYYTNVTHLVGFRLLGGKPPTVGAQILVGLLHSDGSRAVIKGFVIHYTSGGQAYSTVVPYSLAMCVSAPCKPPAFPAKP